jgi:6-phosphogluconolactonase (cycloisomerase 2 family)
MAPKIPLDPAASDSLLPRRQFLRAAGAASGMALLGLTGLSGCAVAKSPTSSTGTAMFAYVGSRTTRERNARGDGISVFKLDPDNGSLSLVQVVGDLVNPSFLTLDAAGEHLYTVHGDLSDVSAFKVDRQTGKLQFINRQSTGGKNPVHLAIDPSGRHLVVSNHIGSSLAVLPIRADGGVAELTQLVPLTGPLGPHRIEQKLAKPHFNPFDPSGKFIVVPDKGLDRTFSFRFENGKLTPAASEFAVAREGAGPRHLAFHPKQQFAYVVNELDSSVTTYQWTPESGALTALQILPTLPSNYTGNSRASEIEVDPAGRFLYASNRGYDSIAIFRIDQHSGLLSLVDLAATKGKTPRFFTLTRDGRYLYALNEDSDTIVTMAVDKDSGRLQPTGFSVPCGSPVCMVFSA